MKKLFITLVLLVITSCGFATTGDTIIVFERYMGNNNAEIFKVNVDGSGIINIINDSTYNNLYPKISPDGKHIGFVTNKTGQYQVFTMDVNGNHLRQITTTGCMGGQYGNAPGRFDWLSDSAIVFMYGTGLFTMNLNGTNLIQISTASPAGNDFYTVVVSSDGSKIAASTREDGDILCIFI